MASETISGQLQDLGVKDLKRFEQFIKYYGDKTHSGTWGCYWNNHLVQVHEEPDFVVILLDYHEWYEEGGGISMASVVRVLWDGKLYDAPEQVYRAKFDSGKDRWDRELDAIVSVRREDDKFIVRVRCKRNSKEIELTATEERRSK